MKHTGLGCQWMLEFRWLWLCLQAVSEKRATLADRHCKDTAGPPSH